MTPFTKQVIDIIRSIPKGKVMTYGQIAGIAGSPQGARQVVRILHSMSEKHCLPWHRIINAKGQIAIKEEQSKNEQIILLRSEGVIVEMKEMNGYVDLGEYQWHPHLNKIKSKNI